MISKHLQFCSTWPSVDSSSTSLVPMPVLPSGLSGICSFLTLDLEVHDYDALQLEQKSRWTSLVTGKTKSFTTVWAHSFFVVLDLYLNSKRWCTWYEFQKALQLFSFCWSPCFFLLLRKEKQAFFNSVLENGYSDFMSSYKTRTKRK